MVTYEAKIKISDTIYTISWDASDKVSIPTEFEAIITSVELMQILNTFHALRLWMNTDAKQEIRITRTL